MTNGEIIIGMVLLRRMPDYAYVIVEKDSENTSYTIKDPYKEVENDEKRPAEIQQEYSDIIQQKV